MQKSKKLKKMTLTLGSFYAKKTVQNSIKPKTGYIDYCIRIDEYK